MLGGAEATNVKADQAMWSPCLPGRKKNEQVETVTETLKMSSMSLCVEPVLQIFEQCFKMHLSISGEKLLFLPSLT